MEGALTMPIIRTYHGISGEHFTEVSEEEYAKVTAEYEDLKAQAERAGADLEHATAEDLQAPRKAYELAYKLQRDLDMDGLQVLMDTCERNLREKTLKAAQKQADARAAEADFIKAVEKLGEALVSLQHIPSKDELPQVTVEPPIMPESLVGADLARERIVPTGNHGAHVAYANRLEKCMDVIKGGIPADTRKKAEALLEELSKRNAALDAVNVANLETIAAEQRRRDEERRREEQAQAEAENLPETVAELRQRIAALEAKV